MSVTSATVGAQAYTMPLINQPQQFDILLAGILYTIISKWNDMGQYWCLDIQDSNGVPIVYNVPLITGADCLDGLDYLDFGGSLYVLTTGDVPDAVPTLDNLGIDSFLYFVTVNPNE